jgi:hypothetical protein
VPYSELHAAPGGMPQIPKHLPLVPDELEVEQPARKSHRTGWRVMFPRASMGPWLLLLSDDDEEAEPPSDRSAAFAVRPALKPGTAGRNRGASLAGTAAADPYDPPVLTDAAAAFVVMVAAAVDDPSRVHAAERVVHAAESGAALPAVGAAGTHVLRAGRGSSSSIRGRGFDRDGRRVIHRRGVHAPVQSCRIR